MVPPELLTHLEQGWGRLMDRYRMPPAAGESVFRLLVAVYSAPDRYYHNLDHLTEMFRVVARLTASTEDPGVVQLAVWFHDAVYDPRAKDNEARSAELAVTLLRLVGVPRPELDRITRLIHATSHRPDFRPPDDRETAILLDADLAILGAGEERYRQYAEAIRREYAWVPDPAYSKARAKVLENFLGRPRIFCTDLMHEEAEGPARANLEAELGRLGFRQTSGSTS